MQKLCQKQPIMAHIFFSKNCPVYANIDPVWPKLSEMSQNCTRYANIILNGPKWYQKWPKLSYFRPKIGRIYCAKVVLFLGKICPFSHNLGSLRPILANFGLYRPTLVEKKCYVPKVASFDTILSYLDQFWPVWASFFLYLPFSAFLGQFRLILDIFARFGQKLLRKIFRVYQNYSDAYLCSH